MSLLFAVGEHLLWLGDTDAMFAEIEWCLTSTPRHAEPDRTSRSVTDQ